MFLRRNLSLTQKVAGSSVLVGLVVLSMFPILYQKIVTNTQEDRKEIILTNAQGIMSNLLANTHKQNLYFVQSWVSNNMLEIFTDFELQKWNDSFGEQRAFLRENLGQGYLLVYDSEADLLDIKSLADSSGAIPSVDELEQVKQAVFWAVENDGGMGVMFYWQNQGIYRVDVAPIFDVDQIISHLIVVITDISMVLKNFNRATNLETLVHYKNKQQGSLPIEYSVSQNLDDKTIKHEDKHWSFYKMPFAPEEFEDAILVIAKETSKWVDNNNQLMQQAFAGACTLVFLIALMGTLFARSIVKPIQQRSFEVSEQNKNLIDITNQLNTIANKFIKSNENQDQIVSSTVSSARNMTAMIESTSSLAVKGNDKLDETKEASGNAETSAQKLEESFVNLKEKNKKLESIIELINGIQDDVNSIDSIVLESKLLSFNAALEGERAGTAGNGFRAVAAQVGTLANNCGNISEMIKSKVLDCSKEISGIIAETKSAIVAGEANKDNNSSQLESIALSIKNLSETFDEIKGSMEGQTKGVSLVRDCMEKLATGNNEQSKSSELLNKACHELHLSSVNIDENIKDINQFIDGKIISKAS